MTDSQQLLAEYVRTGSDAAFGELVSRYVNLVYSVSLRLVSGDAHRAQDVAQTVFVDLARQARSLPGGVMLGGWLHRHACFVAANTLRGERRRQSRERQAVEMNALQDSPETNLALVAPILDEAINELGEEDRAAILLRFFEQRDFRAVGAALGGNEDAARMRVNRALEKLELLLKRRGVTSTTAALAVLLTASAVQAAPAGLAAAISAAVALAGTTLATTATATATKAIAMTTLQKTFIAAAFAVVAGAGIFEGREAAQLRAQYQSLQQQQAPLAGQIGQLNLALANATKQIAALRDDNESLKRNSDELLRLRSEVTRLRQENDAARQRANQPTNVESTRNNAGKPATGGYLAKDQLVNAGFATPEAAAQTFIWAVMSGKYEDVLSAMAPQVQAEAGRADERAAFERGFQEHLGGFQGILMIAKTVGHGAATNRARLQIVKFADGKAPEVDIMSLVRTGNEWKFAGDASGTLSPEDGPIEALLPSLGK